MLQRLYLSLAFVYYLLNVLGCDKLLKKETKAKNRKTKKPPQYLSCAGPYAGPFIFFDPHKSERRG